jgi:hypothetical protein
MKLYTIRKYWGETITTEETRWERTIRKIKRGGVYIGLIGVGAALMQGYTFPEYFAAKPTIADMSPLSSETGEYRNEIDAVVERRARDILDARQPELDLKKLGLEQQFLLDAWKEATASVYDDIGVNLKAAGVTTK